MPKGISGHEQSRLVYFEGNPITQRPGNESSSSYLPQMSRIIFLTNLMLLCQ